MRDDIARRARAPVYLSDAGGKNSAVRRFEGWQMRPSGSLLKVPAHWQLQSVSISAPLKIFFSSSAAATRSIAFQYFITSSVESEFGVEKTYADTE